MTSPAPQSQLNVAAAWARVWGDAGVSVRSDDPSYPRVQAWWTQALNSVMDNLGATARLLEIGAGGAAPVASLAARLFGAAEILACDFRAAPNALDARIRYVPHAAMERLPFDDAWCDVVVSQFAFEYARPEPACTELARILRPGGTVLMLMHHPQSHMATMLPHRLRCIDLGVKLHRIVTGHGARATRAAQLKVWQRDFALVSDRYAIGSGYGLMRADLQDLARVAAAHATGGGNDPPLPDDSAFLDSCGPAALVARAQLAATLPRRRLDELMRRFDARGLHNAAVSHVDAADGRPIGWAVHLRKAR